MRAYIYLLPQIELNLITSNSMRFASKKIEKNKRKRGLNTKQSSFM